MVKEHTSACKQRTEHLGMKDLAKTVSKKLYNLNSLDKALWKETVDFAHLLQRFFMELLPIQPKFSHASIDSVSEWRMIA